MVNTLAFREYFALATAKIGQAEAAVRIGITDLAQDLPVSADSISHPQLNMLFDLTGV